MKVTIDISCCRHCPFVIEHSDYPVSDDGIRFCDYKCGKGDFDIKELGKIHENCPLKTMESKKSKKSVKLSQERIDELLRNEEKLKVLLVNTYSALRQLDYMRRDGYLNYSQSLLEILQDAIQEAEKK